MDKPSEGGLFVVWREDIGGRWQRTNVLVWSGVGTAGGRPLVGHAVSLRNEKFFSEVEFRKKKAVFR